MKVREAAAWRGGVGGSGADDEGENPLTAFCNSRTFDNHSLHMDSVAMAASLAKSLQRNIDSLSEGPLLSIWSDVRRNPYAEGYDTSIPSATVTGWNCMLGTQNRTEGSYSNRRC